MKKSILLFAASVLILRVTFSFAAIREIQMAKCNGTAVIHQGAEGVVCLLKGDGVDLAQGNPAVSGSGVTATIIESKTGLQNQNQSGGASASIKIRFNCSENAHAGDRTVTLRYPTGQPDQFALRVIPRARVTGTDLPTLAGSFRQNVDIVLRGQNLQSAVVLAAIVNDASHPLLSPKLQPTNASISATVVSNSSTEIRVRLNFTATLGMATVRFTLGSADECSGLFSPGATVDVTLDAVGGSNLTFVQSIAFPFGDSPKIGSVAKVRVNFTQPARADTPVFDPGSGRRISGIGQDVLFFILEPADAFAQVAGGTPYDATKLNEITIPAGDQLIDLSFLVKKCPGSGNKSAVFVKTWMQNPNVNTTPQFKQAQFFVDCLR